MPAIINFSPSSNCRSKFENNSPGLERELEFFSIECSSLTAKRTLALHQGTAFQLAEKLMFLKVTAFRPYLNALQ
jgi:hypothetical protein